MKTTKQFCLEIPFMHTLTLHIAPCVPYSTNVYYVYRTKLILAITPRVYNKREYPTSVRFISIVTVDWDMTFCDLCTHEHTTVVQTIYKLNTR